ncbi:MAG: hypothetical protein OXT65_05955 [Alphaproteobacteria bacterium]|nr:hypothetical protein [Alphaproteobacteria bacterium]
MAEFPQESAADGASQDIRTRELLAYLQDCVFQIWDMKEIEEKIRQGVDGTVCDSAGKNIAALLQQPEQISQDLDAGKIHWRDIDEGKSVCMEDWMDISYRLSVNSGVGAQVMGMYERHETTRQFRTASARGTLRARKIKRYSRTTLKDTVLK